MSSILRINKILSYVVLAFGVMLLGSCVTPKKNMPLKIDFSKDSLLILTIKFSNQVSPSYQINHCSLKVKGTKSFRNPEPLAGNDEPFTKYTYFRFRPDNMVNDQFSEYFIAINLPPDNYIIEEISGSAMKGFINGGFFIPFEMAFELKKNQVLYVGHIYAVNRKRKDGERRAGPIIPIIDQAASGFAEGTFDLNIEDNLEKDLRFLIGKCPDLKKTEVTKMIFALPKQGKSKSSIKKNEEEKKSPITTPKVEKVGTPPPEEETTHGTYIAYANGIVRDTETGLEWKVGPDRDMDWNEAMSWVRSLNLDGGGWRMPTMVELEGLYKKGTGFHNMTPLLKTTGWWVWSGETKGSSDWGFAFGHGGGRDWGDADGMRAFAVRSRSEKIELTSLSQKPQSSPTSPKANVIGRDGTYIAYMNGIVRDTKTGLEWKVGPDKDMNWDEAKSWVQSLNLDGGGWRMPTIDELRTLYRKGTGSRNMSPLLKTTAWWVWSGETKDSLTSWLFYFSIGNKDWNYRNIVNYSGGRAFAVRFKNTEKVMKVRGQEDKIEPITTVEEEKKSPITTPKVEKVGTPPPEEETTHFSERLRKLKAMKELGLVSQEEYEREKAKIKGK